MANWIMVVDDDTANLQMAGHILSKNNMRVTALKSGRSMLDYIKTHDSPDLILLDIKMPEMDGFEALKHLRRLEKELGREEIPVIFLTANEDADTESRGFEVGVSDYIHKPFSPDVLLRRINNIVSKQEKMMSLKTEATTDRLTGFLNKGAAGVEMSRICTMQKGALMMIDLDSFKLVNDIYGHEMGDKVLISFSKIIAAAVPAGSKCARVGGDEFVAFGMNMLTEEEVKALTVRLNEELVADAKRLMGEDMDIPLGTSIGAVFVPRHGNDYNALLKLADKALYSVKQNGKHGFSVYRADQFNDDEASVKELDIGMLSAILGERTIPDVALQLDKEAFSYVYRYIMRYTIRNRRTACKILLTLTNTSGIQDEVYKDRCDEMGNHIRESLRKSDILMRSRFNQYFIFLTDIREAAIPKVMNNLMQRWGEKFGNDVDVTYEVEFIGKEGMPVRPFTESNIVVVDDDLANRRVASHVLGREGYKVTAFSSGRELLQYVEKNIPDLILLDIKMPEMDGFEVMDKLHRMERDVAMIPVIFLTADESAEAESKGLSLGAMDFIKKPFVPEIMLLRVQHILELISLQRRLSDEVDKKTEENKSLLLNVVHSLADAIDAKDTYTNGHSDRVARYSREIAKRSGYSIQEQGDIYLMALLHDVGKIGIPDAVINKPAKLTEEEYDLIKHHPVMGARILRNIKEMPKLATGARWHHERYDGGGYPDGLAGEDIPEEARIIAVADAYDAMTSHRSYRDPLSQEYVRSEIERGMSTQFDPKFAGIMLDMISEDVDYKMREQ